MKLCSIDKLKTKQMESINTAQMQLYEFMDQRDTKLLESEQRIFTMVQEKLDELELNIEYTEQFCNEIKKYASDVYTKIPLFTDSRNKLYQNWKNVSKKLRICQIWDFHLRNSCLSVNNKTGQPYYTYFRVDYEINSRVFLFFLSIGHYQSSFRWFASS